MYSLAITFDSHTRQAVDTPTLVEVFKATGEFVTSDLINLEGGSVGKFEAGNYHVRTELPSGELITALVKVPVGDGNVSVALNSEDRSPREDMAWAYSRQSVGQASQPHYASFANIETAGFESTERPQSKIDVEIVTIRPSVPPIHLPQETRRSSTQTISYFWTYTKDRQEQLAQLNQRAQLNLRVQLNLRALWGLLALRALHSQDVQAVQLYLRDLSNLHDLLDMGAQRDFDLSGLLDPRTLLNLEAPRDFDLRDLLEQLDKQYHHAIDDLRAHHAQLAQLAQLAMRDLNEQRAQFYQEHLAVLDALRDLRVLGALRDLHDLGALLVLLDQIDQVDFSDRQNREFLRNQLNQLNQPDRSEEAGWLVWVDRLNLSAPFYQRSRLYLRDLRDRLNQFNEDDLPDQDFLFNQINQLKQLEQLGQSNRIKQVEEIERLNQLEEVERRNQFVKVDIARREQVTLDLRLIAHFDIYFVTHQNPDTIGSQMIELRVDRNEYQQNLLLVVPYSRHVELILVNTNNLPSGEDSLNEVSTPLVRPLIETQNARAQALLAYLSNGATRSVQKLGNEMAESAVELLRGKVEDPFSAAIAGYALLQIGSYEQASWMNNLADWFSAIPDGAIIYGTACLRRNDYQQAAQYLTLAVARGLPTYTIGLRLLLDGLRQLNYIVPEQVGKAFEAVYRTASWADWESQTTSILKPIDVHS